MTRRKAEKTMNHITGKRLRLLFLTLVIPVGLVYGFQTDEKEKEKTEWSFVVDTIPQDLTLKDLNIELGPQDYVSQGHRFLENEMFTEAFAAFHKAVEMDSQYADAWLYRGLARVELGQTDLAMKDYDQAVKLGPENTSAYTFRGGLHLDRKEHAKALADFNQAAKLSPNDFTVFGTRGMVYMDMNQHQKAIADFDHSLGLNDQMPFIYVLRGECYLLLKNYDKALADFDKALAMDPQMDLAKFYREKTVKEKADAAK